MPSALLFHLCNQQLFSAHGYAVWTLCGRLHCPSMGFTRSAEKQPVHSLVDLVMFNLRNKEVRDALHTATLEIPLNHQCIQTVRASLHMLTPPKWLWSGTFSTTPVVSCEICPCNVVSGDFSSQTASHIPMTPAKMYWVSVLTSAK